ncbi:7942_t:CDS:1, partial [Funneliformis mosseae]
TMKAVRRAYILVHVKEGQFVSEALKVNELLSGYKQIQLNPILQLSIRGPLKKPSV